MNWYDYFNEASFQTAENFFQGLIFYYFLFTVTFYSYSNFVALKKMIYRMIKEEQFSLC